MPIFVPFLIKKMVFFTSFCIEHFDIQEITITFTFQKWRYKPRMVPKNH